MSDPKPNQKPIQKPEAEEDLLEFLGGIDDANEDTQDGDFADFLANTDIDKLAPPGKKPVAAAKGKDHE